MTAGKKEEKKVKNKDTQREYPEHYRDSMRAGAIVGRDVRVFLVAIGHVFGGQREQDHVDEQQRKHDNGGPVKSMHKNKVGRCSPTKKDSKPPRYTKNQTILT